jgi:hypothetical protein
MDYSNPRMEAIIDNWPYGSMRTTATFTVECTNRGERGVRTTINPKNGRVSAPKKLTYAKQVRIVDGADGRTYLIEKTMYGSISVMQSNMQFQQEYIGTNDPRYPTVNALFPVYRTPGTRTP